MLNISVHYGIQIALSMRSHSITIIIGKGKKKKDPNSYWHEFRTGAMFWLLAGGNVK